MTAVLAARGLSAGYAGTSVVHDLDIEVGPGEVVALLGANGAGKTTTLLTIAGELEPLAGEVRFLGDVSAGPLHKRAKRGMSFVPEERAVLTTLTTRQNIGLAGSEVSAVTELFPELNPLLSRRASLLSGGEQQMLALGRAMARPGTRLLLADELSLGLAPRAVGRLLRGVRSAAEEGMAALLVEQHVHRVLDVADRVYVLAQGRIAYSGSAAEAREQLNEIQAHYLTQGRTKPPPDAPVA